MPTPGGEEGGAGGEDSGRLGVFVNDGGLRGTFSVTCKASCTVAYSSGELPGSVAQVVFAWRDGPCAKFPLADVLL